MKTIYNLGLAALMLLSFGSCTKEDIAVSGKYSKGVFVSNEGVWGASNASVSFVDSDGNVENNIFKNVNGRVLGDVLQSIYMDEDYAYLTLNASNKVEVVSKDDFSETGVISGLNSPRYTAKGSQYLYISQWGGSGSVAVVDPVDFAKIKEVEAGNGPEGLAKFGSEIWVANSGGWGTDNTITVIDDNTQNVKSTIVLSGDNPKSFVLESDGDVWVLCSGFVTYNDDWSIATQTPSKLIEIDPVSKAEKRSIVISETSHPPVIAIDESGTNIFYGGGYSFAGVYKFNTSQEILPESPLADNMFYGFNVDSEGNVWGAEAPSFTEAGIVRKINTEGDELNSFEVGIGPNGVYFN